MAKTETQFACPDGRHVAGAAMTVDGVCRARCRVCGCALFRKDGFRRWVLSGSLG